MKDTWRMWEYIRPYISQNNVRFENLVVNECYKILSGNRPCQYWVTNQCFRDWLSLHHDGQRKEWPKVTNIYHKVLLMPQLYRQTMQPEGGVKLCRHPSHSRFGTLLLDLKHDLMLTSFCLPPPPPFSQDKESATHLNSIPCFHA